MQPGKPVGDELGECQSPEGRIRGIPEEAGVLESAICAESPAGAES